MSSLPLLHVVKASLTCMRDFQPYVITNPSPELLLTAQVHTNFDLGDLIPPYYIIMIAVATSRDLHQSAVGFFTLMVVTWVAGLHLRPAVAREYGTGARWLTFQGLSESSR